MKRISMDTPTVLSFSTEEMSQERDALLLECGTYPDKGLSVTEEDLDGIVARFSAEGAPIKVEHMDTPLDPLGRVQRIWREGSTLMAKLLFPVSGVFLPVGDCRQASRTVVGRGLLPVIVVACLFPEARLAGIHFAGIQFAYLDPERTPGCVLLDLRFLHEFHLISPNLTRSHNWPRCFIDGLFHHEIRLTKWRVIS